MAKTRLLKSSVVSAMKTMEKTQLIANLNAATNAEVIDLTPEELLHLHAHTKEALKTKISQFNHSELNELSKKLQDYSKKFPEEKKEDINSGKQSFFSSVKKAVKNAVRTTVALPITIPVSIAQKALSTLDNIILSRMLNYVNEIRDKKANEELKAMQNHFELQTIFYEAPENIGYLLGNLQLDDSFLATLFRQHQHEPTVLRQILTNIFNAPTKDFKQDSLFAALHSQFTAEGQHDLAEEENKIQAQAKQQTLLAEYIHSKTDSLIQSPEPGFKQKSIYLEPLLASTPSISTAFKDSFFLALLEKAINKRCSFSFTDKNKELTHLKQKFNECSQRLITHYEELSTLFNDAMLTVENELNRLQRDSGGFFKTDGGSKAKAIFDALKDAADHATSFLLEPRQPAATLRENVHGSITRCLAQPAMTESRNRTADVLRAVLGIILFIPTVGATYWSDNLYGKFFGAPRSVSNMQKASQQLVVESVTRPRQLTP